MEWDMRCIHFLTRGSVYSEAMWRSFSVAKNRDNEMNLYNTIEKVAPEIIAEKRHIFKGVSRMSISTAALFMRCLVFLWSFTPLLPLRESLAGVPTGLRRLSA